MSHLGQLSFRNMFHLQAKLTRSENEKQQLLDEIRKIREREKRTKEELERKLVNIAIPG